ncbi:hypothetical protein Pla175_43670 [Pirellulimonas nuda]|uniref:Dockerin domain-containing protein n=1 Tax=Pirellulimonas nuda TaxID=2528009 RepID=A0A518DHK3_9BACT|nr:hypothetical protein [Pirellulimonas nuda]QDU90953.1 hypothetical protein Pla175_43670 [Pirellulimonas nuda]
MHRSVLLGAAFGLLLSAAARLAAQPVPVMVGRNFEGTYSLLTQPIPADTMGAAGVDHFVELNNDKFKIYNKSDGLAVQNKGIRQFWIDAGVTPISTPFDPRVVYDPHARRWYAVAVDARLAANNFLFAVSDSSDPTQSWTGFSIDSDTDDSNWADFPMLAYNADAVFISSNMPPLSAPQTRTALAAFPKADLLLPSPSIANMALFQDVAGAVTGFTPQVAIDDSNTFGRDLELLSVFNTAAGTLQRTLIHGPPGVPQLVPGGQVAVAGASQPPSVVQPGAPGVPNLEANDSRFSANLVLRGNELYAVQSIEDAGLAAVRFLRIDLANNSVLESQVIVDPASRALTFPSIAVSPTGEVVIGVTGTSTSEFAGSYAIVGKTAAGVTTFNPPMLLRAGLDNYVRLSGAGQNRWGDYSATTLDPADPNIFWTAQEFAKNSTQWATQVTELIVPLPDDARWADANSGNIDDATMWQTLHGATPLPSEDLIFSRATTPGASYTVNFPPAPAGAYANKAVSVRQGGTVFDLGGNGWDVALHFEVAPHGGTPHATIRNGNLTSVVGAIAPGDTTQGSVLLDNAQWGVQTMQIGSQGNPIAGMLPGAAGGVGSITIDNNSRLSVVSTLNLWAQGTANLIDGTLMADRIQSVAPGAGSPYGLRFQGGVLHVNQFDGELVNQGGVLAPGGIAQVGDTDITLSYDQPGGKLAIDVAGAAPGAYDRLTVGGSATLGELEINFLGGYAPSLSDTIEFVQAGFIPASGVASLLTHSTLPSLGRLLDWHLDYLPTALTLVVVPSLTGDYNADGVVDSADYTVWRDSFLLTGVNLAADANHDRTVNQIDYLLWRINFGMVAPAVGGATGVPEPAGWLLVLGVGLAAVAAARRWPNIVG